MTRSNVFDLYPNMLALLTLDGQFQDLNAKWPKTLGWSADELRSKSIFELIHEDDRDEAEKVFSRLRASQGSLFFENRVFHKDRSIRYLYWSAELDPATNVIVVSARERTEFRKHRETLANEKQKLEAVFSSMLEGVLVQNEYGNVVQYNEAALKILGLTKEQILKIDPYDPEWLAIKDDGTLLNEADHPAAIAQRTGKPQINQIIGFSRPDGNTRWVSVTATPLIEGGAQVSYQCVVTFHDITAERNSRAALDRKDKEVLRVINGLPAMIGYWDRDLKNVLANRAYTAVFGLEPSEIKGKHIREILGEVLFSKNQTYMKKALAGFAQSFETETKNAKGETEYKYILYLPDTQDGKVVGFHTVVTDITQMKNLEKERCEFETKFMAASKMSALGEMAAGIAHEINNPLAIINGKTAILQQRLAIGKFDAPRFDRDLRLIGDTVERIAKTVRGLLAFSRNAEAEPMKATNVVSVINETLDLCREKMKTRGIDLRIRGDAAIEVDCRSNQISQILMNLLNNSCDAVSNRPQPWIEIGVEANSQTVKISVTDSGAPIAPEIIAKVMNPFFTTKEVGKGTGLGLSISKGLAENHGGTLFYDSGRVNTSFVLEIPLRSEILAQAASL